ncbi:MAG TPA: hypothetical protein VIJ94_11375 [Caulobacteraceae bacterium]
MTRPITPAQPRDETRVLRAINLLCDARDLLAEAGCRKAAAKVRLAISSAKGAERHMLHRRNATVEAERGPKAALELEG